MACMGPQTAVRAGPTPISDTTKPGPARVQRRSSQPAYLGGEPSRRGSWIGLGPQASWGRRRGGRGGGGPQRGGWLDSRSTGDAPAPPVPRAQDGAAAARRRHVFHRPAAARTTTTIKIRYHRAAARAAAASAPGLTRQACESSAPSRRGPLDRRPSQTRRAALCALRERASDPPDVGPPARGLRQGVAPVQGERPARVNRQEAGAAPRSRPPGPRTRGSGQLAVDLGRFGGRQVRA